MNNKSDSVIAFFGGMVLSIILLVIVVALILSEPDKIFLKNANMLLNDPKWTIDTIYRSSDNNVTYEFKYLNNE